jgi:hypothetical protein
VRPVALILAFAFAVIGFAVAFGVWSVGYCGAFTPDAAPSGTLRHDLCRGAGGHLMGALVVVSWIWGAVAPGVGAYVGARRDSVMPLALLTVVGAIPIATIAVLAEVLPQG